MNNKFAASNKTSVFICVHAIAGWLIFLCFAANAQTLAPGAPGNDAQWATAGKQAIGTSASLESKVWFTLADGALTEVYYPDVTVANVHLLQFVVVNPRTKKVETERDDATHEIKVTRPDSLSFQQINTAKSGEWKITKTYATDPESDSILINLEFEPKNKRYNDYQLYVYYDPSLGNTGMHDTGWIQKKAYLSDGKYETDAFLSEDGDKASALVVSSNKFFFSSNGFLGVIDGLTEIKNVEGFFKRKQYEKAENGNIVQVGGFSRIRVDILNNKYTFVLGFGNNSKNALQKAGKSLDKGFQKSQAEYEKGWSDYVKTLPKVEPKYQAQFNMAAMVLKAQEDKTVRGANVASLTIPWGGGKNANEDVGGGYHLVWARDLYQVFTAYLALGDTAAANRALDFLFNIQQKPDGSFPQNSWLDGRNGWGGLQMDEVGYPLIMAYQLKRFDKATYENHVKKAADFIVRNGPVTPQERWEEKPGYSPSTIAAEIAGLICAAEIARKNNDETSANLWLKTADDWQSNVEKWTATTNGKFGDGNYYIRLAANGKPDAGEKIELSNSSGAFPENEIVDAGFLELVRLGIKSPDDPLIVKSLKVIDAQIKVNTPNGESFYRYNHDGYGEQPDGRRWNFDGTYSGTGRLWALLAGERGQYEIALAKPDVKIDKSKVVINFQNPQSLTKAKARLDAMLAFANEGLMISEQIWDKAETPKNIDKQFVPELKFGEGTGSATPLAWSMAQFIRLAVNLQAGKNLDTPDVVYNRYVLGKNSEVESQNSEDKNQNIQVTQENIDCLAAEHSHSQEKFLQKFPVIKKCGENTNYAVFTFRGDAKEVEIVGDFTSWKSKKYLLQQEEQYAPTKKQYDINKYISLEFKPTARVEYKLIVDGKWITDPLNPNKVDNGVGGENSFFTMPDYKPTVWDKDTESIGKLETVEIASKVWNETRKIQVYVPQIRGNVQLSLKKSNPFYPVLYLQDGADYINRAKAIQIQENLVKAEKVKPFIMVFVDYKDRMKEYRATDDYAKFLATEVVPAIDKQYRTIQSRDGRAVLGASLGGVTSIHTALKYPEIFGRVGGQSASFWIDDERVAKELETLDASKNKFVFYLDTGTLEGADDDRRAVETLEKKGFEVVYQETEAGHNWTGWRDRLANAFVALWRESK